MATVKPAKKLFELQFAFPAVDLSFVIFVSEETIEIRSVEKELESIITGAKNVRAATSTIVMGIFSNTTSLAKRSKRRWSFDSAPR